MLPSPLARGTTERLCCIRLTSVSVFLSASFSRHRQDGRSSRKMRHLLQAVVEDWLLIPNRQPVLNVHIFNRSDGTGLKCDVVKIWGSTASPEMHNSHSRGYTAWHVDSRLGELVVSKFVGSNPWANGLIGDQALGMELLRGSRYG